MSLVTFPFRVKPELKQAICDRARVENRTQTDLIKEAVKEYLLKPLNQVKHDDSPTAHQKPSRKTKTSSIEAGWG